MNEKIANDIVFSELRLAGFEDGIDFVVAKGPASLSLEARAWLNAHQSRVFLKASHLFCRNEVSS